MHATKRVRGAGGRFLPSNKGKKADQQGERSDEESSEVSDESKGPSERGENSTCQDIVQATM